jgi:hypothetical protein
MHNHSRDVSQISNPHLLRSKISDDTLFIACSSRLLHKICVRPDSKQMDGTKDEILSVGKRINEKGRLTGKGWIWIIATIVENHKQGSNKEKIAIFHS